MILEVVLYLFGEQAVVCCVWPQHWRAAWPAGAQDPRQGLEGVGWGSAVACGGLVWCAAWWYSTINLQLMYINLYFYLRRRAQVYLLKIGKRHPFKCRVPHDVEVMLHRSPYCCRQQGRCKELWSLCWVFRARSPSGGCTTPGTSTDLDCFNIFMSHVCINHLCNCIFQLLMKH